MTNKWQPAVNLNHPLAEMETLEFDDLLPEVLAGPQTRFGSSYFLIVLKNREGSRGQPALITGLYNKGVYPAQNWVEVIRAPDRLYFLSQAELKGKDLENIQKAVFSWLAGLLPAGGHIMHEYDSGEQAETASLLNINTPPVITPLGWQLYTAGFDAGFKDWYFAEGGNEGPRKLQAYKPLNSEHLVLKTQKMITELAHYTQTSWHSSPEPLLKKAREALRVLKQKLQSGINLDTGKHV